MQSEQSAPQNQVPQASSTPPSPINPEQPAMNPVPPQPGFQPQPASTFPPQKPGGKKTGLIVGLIIGGVLLVAGLAVLIVLLTHNKKSDNQTAGTSNMQNTSDTSTTGSGFASPEAVATAYAKAYETKDFSQVVAQGKACSEYVKTYSTDTSSLRKQLEPYTVQTSVTGRGPDTSDPSTVQMIVDVKLTQSGKTTDQSILVYAHDEGNNWTFCGESAYQGN